MVPRSPFFYFKISIFYYGNGQCSTWVPCLVFSDLEYLNITWPMHEHFLGVLMAPKI